MDRRRFLASVSASVPLALAGCLGGQDNDPSTTAPTQTTTDPTTDGTTAGTTTETSDGPLSFGEHANLSGDRSIAVEGADATVFVVTADGAERLVHAGNTTRYTLVTFQIDEITEYESFVRENVVLTILDQNDDERTFEAELFPLGGGFNQFTAAFPVPNEVTPYLASVNLDTGDTTAAWEFDAGDISDITKSVDFEVTEVSAPDAVESEGSFGVNLTVDNAGDPMTFVAKLHGTASAPTRTSFDLDGSTETTVTVDASAPAADGDSEFEFTVDWGADTAARTVSYE